MSRYRHPHLVRGTVHTPKGAFVISRGIVDVPDDVGAMLGWMPLDHDHRAAALAGNGLAKPDTATGGDLSQ